MREYLQRLAAVVLLTTAFAVFSQSGPGIQTHAGSGLVLQVRPQQNEVVVSMKEIPGFMEAMVMPLPVRAAKDLCGINPGMMVDFTLVVTQTTSYAEKIRPHQFVSFENDPQGASRLAVIEKLLTPDADTAVPLGDHVPNFTLEDQDGHAVSLSQFSGKVVGMTFVYTRCPLPNFCLRLSNNFGQLQKRFAKQMGRNLILLTVTLDPTIDGGDALARYAAIWKADTQNWKFLTGSVAEVRKVSLMFGVVSCVDEGTITHSLHTVIIDRQGNLAANLEGNEFTGKQLGDLVEAEFARPSHSPGAERAGFSKFP
jgi:protein SCO1/2